MTPKEYSEWGGKYWQTTEFAVPPGVLHASIGIATEAGEILDIIKKGKFHKVLPDREKLIDEVGDTLYYISRLLDEIGSTFEEAMIKNKAKLDYRMTWGKNKDAEAARQKQAWAEREASQGENQQD